MGTGNFFNQLFCFSIIFFLRTYVRRGFFLYDWQVGEPLCGLNKTHFLFIITVQNPVKSDYQSGVNISKMRFLIIHYYYVCVQFICWFLAYLLTLQ